MSSNQIGTELSTSSKEIVLIVPLLQQKLSECWFKGKCAYHIKTSAQDKYMYTILNLITNPLPKEAKQGHKSDLSLKILLPVSAQQKMALT